MKLEEVKKGISIYQFEDRGVEKVSIVKILNGKPCGKIVALKDYIDKLRQAKDSASSAKWHDPPTSV
jgi:hypothetical protein